MATYETATRHDTDSIIEAARLGIDPTELELGSIYTAFDADGNAKVIDLATTDHLARMDAIAKRNGDLPSRKAGHVQVTEHASLSKYVGEQGQTGRTTLWANRDAGRIVAVLNGHLEPGDTPAGWGDHRATLTLALTPTWKAWTDNNNRQINQIAFADFLEDHLPEIVEPDGAELLEVATSIQATTGAVVKSAVRLDNGEVQIRYEETIEATAGKAGHLQIPTRIKLALTPYEGGEPYGVEARIRYRLNNGALTLAYILDRPEDVLRAAFGDTVAKVEEATGLTVLYGTPGGA